MPLIPLQGRQFGRLTVIRLEHGGDAAKWVCRCKCGSSKVIAGASLKRGLTKSCGCLAKEATAARNKLVITTHGASKSPEYKVWQGVHQRCGNPKDKDFSKYGGRGIFVCERWSAFENFIADMGARPERHSIERINVNKGYEPTNCRWATTADQNVNKRNTVKILSDGFLRPLAVVIGDSHSAEYQRFRKQIRGQECR